MNLEKSSNLNILKSKSMKKSYYSLCFGLIFSIFSFGQSETPFFSDKKDEKSFNEFSKNSIIDTITLKEVVYVELPKFNNSTDKNYYYWLRSKLLKVYPFHLKAVKEYNSLHDSIILAGKNPAIRKLIRSRQNDLANEYETQLRNLTRTEGRIFSKLMHRKTKKTTYEIIKELRGGFNAFWWNVKAGFVDIDLKEPFEPKENRQDYFLETIINRAKAEGYIFE